MGNTPKLRFEGYSGDWKRRTLGDVFIQTSNYVNPKEDGIALWSLTVEDGLTPKTERYVREFLVKKDDKFKEVCPGDIVYNPMNMTLGAVGYNGMDHSVAVSGYYTTMVAGEDYDSYFINTWLKSPQAISLYKEYATGTLLEKQRVQFPTLSTIPAVFPLKDEQAEIGTLFGYIDELIALYQQKTERLATAKQFYLQNMFPKRGEKIPSIRFADYKRPWHFVRLGDVVERVTRKNENSVCELPLTISAQYGLIDQNEFFDRRIASKDVSGYYLIRNGEFAYNKSTSGDAPWGAVKRLDRYDEGVLSTLYIVFRIKDEAKTCSEYIVSYYTTNLWHKDIRSIAAEGARNHGLLNIAPSDFFDTMIIMPEDYAEQKELGEFFRGLERLTAFHQSKVDTLKALKRFLLQNMII